MMGDADQPIPAPPAFDLFPAVRTGFVLIAQKPEGTAFYVYDDAKRAEAMRSAFGMAAVVSQVVPAAFMWPAEVPA